MPDQPSSMPAPAHDCLAVLRHGHAQRGSYQTLVLHPAPELEDTSGRLGICSKISILNPEDLQALEFVRDLDSGPLSGCPTGAKHFTALRKATDRLVNSVLQLRQLIQRRRGPNPGDTPRPLPRNDSFSSFTESTASGGAQGVGFRLDDIRLCQHLFSAPYAARGGHCCHACGTADIHGRALQDLLPCY